jgi:hypothetical protein
MPYSHTTLETAENLLAGLLSDLQGNVSKVRWPSAELQLNLFEAMRTWNLLTGQWEASTDPIAITAGSPWVDIPASSSLRAYTLRDRDLIGQIQYHFFEPYDPIDGTGMSEMWTFDRIVKAIQRRRDQFLHETRCRVTRLVTPTDPDVIEAYEDQVELDGSVNDVVRAAWASANGARTERMTRVSDQAAGFTSHRILNAQGTPRSYVFTGSPITIELLPGPITSGRLDLITVDAGATLDPATGSGTLLGIPDDMAWIVKWGAMATLLAEEGARDYARALFCERRYRMGVAAALMHAPVSAAWVNGRHVPIDTLEKVDAGRPLWQSQRGTPRVVAIAGGNLIALANNPAADCNLELELVRNTPIPAAGEYIQLGKEQLDLALGYAAHLCLFKVGGTEFAASTHLADNFFEAAVERNSRLASSMAFEEERVGQQDSDAKARGLRRVTGGTVEGSTQPQ